MANKGSRRGIAIIMMACCVSSSSLWSLEMCAMFFASDIRIAGVHHRQEEDSGDVQACMHENLLAAIVIDILMPVNVHFQQLCCRCHDFGSQHSLTTSPLT